MNRIKHLSYSINNGIVQICEYEDSDSYFIVDFSIFKSLDIGIELSDKDKIQINIHYHENTKFYYFNIKNRDIALKFMTALAFDISKENNRLSINH